MGRVSKEGQQARSLAGFLREEVARPFMPEIETFATRADRAAFARFVLAQGATPVPSLVYETRRYEKIRDLGRFEHFRKSSQLFLITHPSFTARPIDMIDVDRKEGRRYFLAQRSGGAAKARGRMSLHRRGCVKHPPILRSAPRSLRSGRYSR